MKNSTIKILSTILLFTLLTNISIAQIGINEDNSNPDASALLDVKSTSKGVLMPRMTEAERNAISNPATSLMVYQTDGSQGFYYNQGTSSTPDWVRIGDSGSHNEDPREEIDNTAHNAIFNGKYTMYLISQPGSYYLTANINASQNDAFGIVINSSNVTLDLNGFTIKGKGAAGTVGKGIYVENSSDNITIKNGIVRDWKETGIDAVNARNSLFTELLVSENGDKGLLTGRQTAIIECIGYKNGTNGIQCGGGGNIVRCTSSENVGSGYTTDTASQVVHCTALDNDTDGISLGIGSMASACIAMDNDLIGIDVADNCSVIKCTAYSNLGTGIRVANQCLVTLCLTASNNGNGIEVTGTTGHLLTNVTHRNVNGIKCSNITSCEIKIDNNQITDNTGNGLEMVSAGGLVIRNRCAGNSTDYTLQANTNHGPIISVISAGDISGTTNANHPFANFRY